jgi:hypothetical protein
MQTWEIITICVAVAIVVGLFGFLISDWVRSRHLRGHFGQEYERTVSEMGDRRAAESELARREKHVRSLKVRPLNVSERQRYLEQWKLCQTQFVDDPAGAVDSADGLVTEIMRARGYSADNPHDRLSDISAAYPNMITEYRMADEIVTRRDDASTEDLRKAFVQYRALFDEMLGGQDEELKRAS